MIFLLVQNQWAKLINSSTCIYKAFTYKGQISLSLSLSLWMGGDASLPNTSLANTDIMQALKNWDRNKLICCLGLQTVVYSSLHYINYISHGQFFCQTSFIVGFLVVLGRVDGTFIRIQTPTENEPDYINLKGYNSLNVMVLFLLEYLICYHKIKGQNQGEFCFN